MVNAQGKKFPVLMEEEEIAMIGRLLENGLRCFRLYQLTVPAHLATSSVPHGHDEKLEKDVIDGFATIFTMMESRAFREVFTVKMDVLFNAIVDNPKSPLMYIPQHFLGSNLSLQANNSGAANNQAQIGRVFADILLTFLVKRLKEMTVPFTDSPQSATYVHLFRHVFASVEVNDVVLRPYIGPIVTSILRIVTEVRNPINYFAILRALFRSIGGGKFELLYKEFLPTLPRARRHADAHADAGSGGDAGDRVGAVADAACAAVVAAGLHPHPHPRGAARLPGQGGHHRQARPAHARLLGGQPQPRLPLPPHAADPSPSCSPASARSSSPRRTAATAVRRSACWASSGGRTGASSSRRSTCSGKRGRRRASRSARSSAHWAWAGRATRASCCPWGRPSTWPASCSRPRPSRTATPAPPRRLWPLSRCCSATSSCARACWR